MWSFIQFLKLLLYEYCLIRKFNLCITVSEKDLKTLKLLGCTSEANFLEVPIGVNVLEYRNFPSTDYKKYHLSFCGAMSYGPNKDAILYFNDKILPFIKNVIPNIKILIIGSNPPKEIMELPKETYTITGYVKDIKKYLSQSSVFISPLRMGGGSKVKIIQAMACGLPVVTTQQGAQGLQIINGKHIIIADKPKVFAKSTIRLLNDNNLYKNISISGQSLAFSRYDINRIADNFCSSLNLTYNNLQNS